MKALIISLMITAAAFSSSSTMAADSTEALKTIQNALKTKDLLCYDLQTGIKYYASSLNSFLGSKDLNVSMNNDQSIVTVKKDGVELATSIDFKLNATKTEVETLTLTDSLKEDGSIIRSISCY